MSFPLVCCSSCKSSLRIASCQISSPKTHTAASNAPRTHFHGAGSKRGTKCQRVRRSQNPLQHTWLALQLSEISVCTGAGKKRFLSFESTTVVPEQALSCCCCSLRVTWKGFGDSSVGQPSLTQPPENSFCSWEKFFWIKLCRCEVPVSSQVLNLCHRMGCAELSMLAQLPNHQGGLAALPQSQHIPLPKSTHPEPQGNSRYRKWALTPANSISHLPSLTFNYPSPALAMAQLHSRLDGSSGINGIWVERWTFHSVSKLSALSSGSKIKN